MRENAEMVAGDGGLRWWRRPTSKRWWLILWLARSERVFKRVSCFGEEGFNFSGKLFQFWLEKRPASILGQSVYY